MTVDKFIARDAIHPIYFDTSYYMVPDGEAGQDVYVVLRDAIAASGMAALSRVVISRRERAVAILPLEKGMVLHTLHEPRDLHAYDTLFDRVPDARPDAEMVKLARQLIERQEGKFEPGRYRGSLRGAAARGDRRQAEGRGDRAGGAGGAAWRQRHRPDGGVEAQPRGGEAPAAPPRAQEAARALRRSRSAPRLASARSLAFRARRGSVRGANAGGGIANVVQCHCEERSDEAIRSGPYAHTGC